MSIYTLDVPFRQPRAVDNGKYVGNCVALDLWTPDVNNLVNIASKIWHKCSAIGTLSINQMFIAVLLQKQNKNCSPTNYKKYCKIFFIYPTCPFCASIEPQTFATFNNRQNSKWHLSIVKCLIGNWVFKERRRHILAHTSHVSVYMFTWYTMPIKHKR